MPASAVYAPPTIVATPRWDDLRRTLAPLTVREQIGLLVGRMRAEPTSALHPELAGEVLALLNRVLLIESSLHCAIYRSNQSPYGPEGWAPTEDYGLGGRGITSRKLITNNGVAFLVDAWQNTLELEIMKFHALGTGSTAEAAADAALVTELTTQYNNSGDFRATGTLTESSNPVFVTVGVNLLDTGATIAEHGIFSVITPASGVLWDRSLTGSQVLAAADSLQTTYSLTCTAGT